MTTPPAGCVGIIAADVAGYADAPWSDDLTALTALDYELLNATRRALLDAARDELPRLEAA